MGKSQKKTPRRNAGKIEFRQFLQDTFADRLRKNPRYSLRSFAGSLSVPPSSLSEFMSGKRKISQKTMLKICWTLGLSEKDMAKFSNFGGLEYTAYNTRPVQQIPLDSFAVISDWYHYAILEMTKLENFVSTAEFISRALGITENEVFKAVERLQRLGLLTTNDEGRWINTYEKNRFITNIDPKKTSAANKFMLKQVLALSSKAIDEVELDRRNHTGMTMAIDRRDLPKAIEKIKSFRRGLCTELERAPKPTDVYHLHISFFPFTQKQGEQ